MVTAKSSGTRVCGAAKQRGPLGRRLLARICLYFSGVSTLSRVPLFGHGIAASNKGVLEHVTSFGSAPKLDSRNLIQRTVKFNSVILSPSPKHYKTHAREQSSSQGASLLRCTANTCSTRIRSDHGIFIFSGYQNPQSTLSIAFESCCTQLHVLSSSSSRSARVVKFGRSEWFSASRNGRFCIVFNRTAVPRDATWLVECALIRASILSPSAIH